MTILRQLSRLAPGSLLAAALLGSCARKMDSTPVDGGPPPPPSGSPFCNDAQLPTRAFVEGETGIHRGDLAADFSVELVDGTQWSLGEKWTGCESYVFVPDTIAKSGAETTKSIWERDLSALIDNSPRNVHYFFLSRLSSDAAAQTSTEAMQARVEEALSYLDEGDASFWRDHLHVVKQRAGAQENWLKSISSGIGSGGFAIDRFQSVRGVGQFADVFRYKSSLQSTGWPYETNLAYAAYEAKYFNQLAATQDRLAQENATVVKLWNGETLSQFAETDATLPSAEQMAKFDTLEVEIEQGCPDPNKVEFGNCGAWDYLANLYVKSGDENIELARFITSYHRETHWVVDISPMLAHLKQGGQRHFRWEFAPEWNKQPTATKLSLRFSNQGKGSAAADVQPLWMGHPRPFNASYNDGLETLQFAIPPDAKKVEVFALITGHGGESMYNCAEFCRHQHKITVNDQSYMLEFPMVGTNDGCVEEVENGMTPNQAGTWWLGRGGWCPGEQVKPWVIDVTELAKPGTTATFSYQGLLGNKTPPAIQDANIQLTSYLVISR